MSPRHTPPNRKRSRFPFRVSVIAAVASNRVIGNDGQLPWRLPEDLRRFRQLTMGHHVIMGRKTFESLPKPLDGRKLVVLTHGKLPPAPAAAGAVTTASTLELAFDIASRRSDDEVFIAGGAQVFKEALPLADRLYLTEIHHDVEGDATFPAWDGRAWRLVSSSTRREAGDRTGVTYTFSTYERTEQ